MNKRGKLILTLFFTLTNVAAEAHNATITSYDPAELLSRIFKPNITIEPRQRGYGLIKFDDESDLGIDTVNQDPEQYGLIDPERDQTLLRFEENDDQTYASYDAYYRDHDFNGNPLKFEEFENSHDLSFNNGNQVTFQDDNKVDDQGNKKKKKRKRRRKPKNGVLPYPVVNYGPAGPGFQGPIEGGYGVDPYITPGYPNGQPFRRPRRPRPKPSFASEALSTVIEALTSIARYDDYQCVPRLLCEAAGGGGLSSSGILQSIAGIQPLLAMLSVYNGISNSPLFVFGRAVFLGMTSKGNIGTCRYAYPECPTDPEQLIYYLNNYNGGFFRFFSAPQNPLPQQNIEQFYNQLGQNQGFPSQQDYGNNLYYPNDPNSGQGYHPNQQDSYAGVNDNQNPPQNYDPHYNTRPSLYNNQDYGYNYAYDYNNYGSGNKIIFKDNARIQNRIQNKPDQNLIEDSSEDDDVQTKWHFPDDTFQNVNYEDYKIKDSRTMRFPEDTQPYNNHYEYNRKGRVINFPEPHNDVHYNRPYIYTNNRYESTTYPYNNGQNNQNYHTNQINTYPSNNDNNYQAIKYYNYNQNPTHNNYQDNQNYNTNRPNYNNDDYYYTNDNKYYNQRPINDYQINQNYYNHRQNMYNNNQKYPATVFNNEQYVFDHKHNFYVKKDNYNNYINNFKRAEDDGLKTVYVVRGHGDPNRPEIVKLRPGQSVH